MTNKKGGVLYIGVTDDIFSRIWEHKNRIYKDSFTYRYNCDKLVYIEEYDSGSEALLREKRIKKWKREWKIRLIEEMNPGWSDLSINWALSQRDKKYKF